LVEGTGGRRRTVRHGQVVVTDGNTFELSATEGGSAINTSVSQSIPLLIVLLLAALLFGVGVVVHLLWIVAAIMLVVWLIGFLVDGRRQKRWYYW
jgi:Flp pilus assembly protein TadB